MEFLPSGNLWILSVNEKKKKKKFFFHHASTLYITSIRVPTD